MMPIKGETLRKYNRTSLINHSGGGEALLIGLCVILTVLACDPNCTGTYHCKKAALDVLRHSIKILKNPFDKECALR